MAKIIFMGTPGFAVPALQAIQEAGHDVPLVLCQPDKKQGRGHKVTAPPTKKFVEAQQDGGTPIPVFQPASVRSNQECIDLLKSHDADFFVVIAYGKILPKEILEIPKKGCINVHASLLPLLRGAAPIQFSLIEGHKTTGVATMLMDEGMDTGDILQVATTEIDPNETTEELGSRLSAMGAELIVKTIAEFDSITPIKQDHDQATYTRMLLKEDKWLPLQLSALDCYNHFRGLMPQPGINASFRSKRLAIKEMRLATETGTLGEEGEILSITADGVEVACNTGSLLLTLVQPENKKPLAVSDWVNGFQVKVGELLQNS